MEGDDRRLWLLRIPDKGDVVVIETVVTLSCLLFTDDDVEKDEDEDGEGDDRAT